MFTFLRSELLSPSNVLYQPLAFMLQRTTLAAHFTLGYLIYRELFEWATYTILIYLCIGYLWFLLDTKPFHEKILLRLEVFN